MTTLFIYTQGEENIQIENLKDDVEAFSIINVIKKDGWYIKDKFFPYHSMTQFEIQED